MPTTKSRVVRYRLRTLFAGFMIVSIFLSVFGRRWHEYRAIEHAVTTLASHSFVVESSAWRKGFVPAWNSSPIVRPQLHRVAGDRGDLFAIESGKRSCDANRADCALDAIGDYVDSNRAGHADGRPPDEVWRALAVLPQLAFLGLQGEVRDSDLAGVMGLDRLTWLDLAHCQLDAFHFERLACRDSLLRLDLTGVDLDDQECQSLANAFRHLEYLAIGYSTISEDGIAALANLGTLRVLVLTASEHSSRPEGTLSGLANVAEILLSKPISIGRLRIANMPRLERVSAVTLTGRAALHSVDVVALDCFNLPSLQKIDLRVRTARLEHLPRLKSIRFRYCEEVFLQDTPALQSIELSSISNGHQVLAELPESQVLEHIRVTGDDSVTDDTVRLLGKFPNLRQVVLEGCPHVTEIGIQLLRSLPLEKLEVK